MRLLEIEFSEIKKRFTLKYFCYVIKSILGDKKHEERRKNEIFCFCVQNRNEMKKYAHVYNGKSYNVQMRDDSPDTRRTRKILTICTKLTCYLYMLCC